MKKKGERERERSISPQKAYCYDRKLSVVECLMASLKKSSKFDVVKSVKFTVIMNSSL